MAKKDQKQDDPAQQDAAQKDRSARGGFHDVADGATKEALLQRESQGAAAGINVNEDYLALTPQERDEKGYFGYSPTGPGENDAPWMRDRADNPSRLGSLGEFGRYGDEKPGEEHKQQKNE